MPNAQINHTVTPTVTISNTITQYDYNGYVEVVEGTVDDMQRASFLASTAVGPFRRGSVQATVDQMEADMAFKTGTYREKQTAVFNDMIQAEIQTWNESN